MLRPRREILQCEGLSCHHSGRLVFSGVSLSLVPGELTSISGPSGIGKTTMLEMLGGARTASASFLALPPHDKRAVIFQAPNLVGHLSARENAALKRQILGMPRKQAEGDAQLLLQRLGLPLHMQERLPSMLSGGEQQRVSIARALLSRPRLLLADEPTASLDEDTANKAMNCIATYAKESGAAVLMFTHDLGLAARFCDRLLRLTPKGLVSINDSATRDRTFTTKQPSHHKKP